MPFGINMKFNFWVVLFLSSSGQLLSQNLIPNPGFEEFFSCPSNHTTPQHPIETKHWYSPSKGTPDLFSACALSFVATPRNFAGVAYPPEGESYIGLYCGGSGETEEKNYREYLTCRLRQPLRKDMKYLLNFYTKPSTHSACLMDTISFAFTNDSVRADHDKVLRDIFYQSVSVKNLRVENGWYFVEYTFIAGGDERFLTIGDFTPPGEGSFEMMNGTTSGEKGASYYLFDHFSLTSYSPMETRSFEIEKPFSLKNVYFEFDSYELRPETFEELAILAEFLSRNPNLVLEIYGNTDVVGTDEYNDQLSLRRAMEIKSKLAASGIDPHRLKVFANGKRKIVSDTDALNRRTGFILTAPE